MRTRRISAFLISLLLATTAAQAKSRPVAGPPAGEAEYRAGWLALIAPSLNPKTVGSLDAREKARHTAISHFNEAVAADPKNPTYQASLSYVCLGVGKYQTAKTAIDLAIDVERKDPVLYLLRGQAEATLAQMDPAAAAQSIGPAIAAFDRAAQMDPKNALPLLQAASVAYDVDRLDLAAPRLQQALTRPECRLYRLPVPTDLLPEKGPSLQIWEQIQLGYWVDLLARGQNVANSLLRLGGQEEKLGQLESAQAYYQQAYEVGRKVGRIEPHLFISVGTAIDILDRVYTAFVRVATAKNDPQATEKWQGELGVLRIGRGELEGIVPQYFAALKTNPPASVEEMLRREAEQVGRVFRGIGLGAFAPEPEPAASPPSPK